MILIQRNMELKLGKLYKTKKRFYNNDYLIESKENDIMFLLEEITNTNLGVFLSFLMKNNIILNVWFDNDRLAIFLEEI